MKIENIKNKAEKGIEKAQNLRELDKIYRKYLGKRRGEITQIFHSLEKTPIKKRIEIGRELNQLKNFLIIKFDQKAREIKEKEREEVEEKEWIDITAPGKKPSLGHLHPLTWVKRETEKIFQTLGFSVVRGPEIETEWYNFDALNIPKEHPARDMWDTFWLKEPESENQKSKIKNQKLLLRTHTSPVQIRYMEKHQPPLRIITPGRCFRHEATDASHDFQFYQLEGLMVDERVTAANFKAIIQEFFQQFFKKPIKIRLRPSYFPFTEPSFEVDVAYTECIKSKIKNFTRPNFVKQKLWRARKSKGICSIYGGDGWLEMLGAGMVHPAVFRAARLNPKNWQGFAFGMGLDRLAMMKYKIDDIRLFYSGDLRFLQQF